MRFSLLALTCFVWSALAAPVLEDRAVIPQFDAFYTPNAGWEAQPVGSILKTRPIVPASLSIFLTQNVDATQLLYRTAGPAGEPLTTVVTVFKPRNSASDRLLVYGFAEDSNARQCAPSYNRKRYFSFISRVGRTYLSHSANHSSVR